MESASEQPARASGMRTVFSGARIFAVADSFDAMTSARAYRPARAASIAVTELRRHRGSQFDPASVEALCASLPEDPVTREPQLLELLGGEV